jgi:radical SAM PhpK family P-methyltransferase
MPVRETVDCLIIGHNETDFADYVSGVEKMGRRSGAYRDLNLGFVRVEGTPHHASSLYNAVMAEGEETPSPKRLFCGASLSPAVAYLGTYLFRRGLSFDYINAFQEEKERLRELLLQHPVLTVAVTTTYYVSVFPILEIVGFIRQLAPQAKIIVGGPFIATKVRVSDAITLDYLFNTIGADVYVNSAQGEEALVNVVRAVKFKTPLSGIKNIIFRADNEYVANPVHRENNRLSDNMVDWSLFDRHRWNYALIRTTISCPFACAFCGFPEHAGKYQAASIEAINRELDSLEDGQSVKRIHFVDDTFNVPKERFKRLLAEMSRGRRRLRWHSQYRCQFADRETVRMMKESGCEGVFLGIESGNDGMLKNMNKKATVDEYKRGIEMLKEEGILTYASFIVGFPGETEETVADTIRFIDDTGVDFFRTQVWYCEQITPIWQQRRKFGLQGSNFEWSHDSMTSLQACDMVEEIFMGHRHSTWVPQYGFDFGNIFQLLNHGLTFEEVAGFIRAFNQGIKEKLINPELPGLTEEALECVRRSLKKGTEIIEPQMNVVKEAELDVDFNLD